MSIFRVLSAVLLSLLLARCLTAAGEDDHRDGLLAKLQTLDKMSDAGVTVRGHQLRVLSDRDMTITQAPIMFALTLTFRHPVVALVLTAEEPLQAPSPIDVQQFLTEHKSKPIGAAGRGVSIDSVEGKTKVAINILRSQIVYFDAVQTADLTVDSIYQFDESGAPVLLGDGRLLSLYRADAAALTLTIKKAEWSTGRGFSRFLTEVKSAVEDGDGRLIVTASGNASPTSPGIWELEIEPRLGYLVRKATFSFANGRKVFSMSNAGVMEVDGIVYPKSADWTTHMVEDRDEFVFDSIDFALDEKVVETAAKAIAERMPNTTILDMRTKKTITTTVDGDGKIETALTYPDSRAIKNPPAAMEGRRWTRWTFILVSGALILLVLVIAGLGRFLSGRRKRS